MVETRIERTTKPLPKKTQPARPIQWNRSGLIQAASLLSTGEGLLGLGAGLYCSGSEDFPNVIGPRRQFGPSLAKGSKVLPVLLEEAFLEIPVAHATGPQAIFPIGGHLRRSDQAQQLNGDVLISIRLGLGR